MKCALCRAKKGKRGCKVTSAQLICPSCCASTRRGECVGCDFYETSLAFQREKQIRNKAFAAEIIPDVDDRCDEALTLVEQGDFDKGQAILEGLLVQHPSYHSVLYGLGVCHCLKERLERASPASNGRSRSFPVTLTPTTTWDQPTARSSMSRTRSRRVEPLSRSMERMGQLGNWPESASTVSKPRWNRTGSI